MKLLFVRATKEPRGEMMSERYTSQNTFFHILDFVIVCRSHEKQDTGTSEPEPGPGLVLRCVWPFGSHTSDVLCVYSRGGQGKAEPSNMSLRSDSSLHRPLDFRNGRHHEDQ